MKILLKEDIDTLGYAGEIHEVADGYGRNYLLPRGLAVKATPGVLKQAAAWRARAEARRAEIRAEYEALAAKVSETHLVFHALAGETGRLYGSVTMMDVADRLNEELGTDIDRRKFDSPPLRELGEHRVSVRLDRDFQPQLLIYIHPEGELIEEAAAVTEEEAELLDADDVEASADEADALEADASETAGAVEAEEGEAAEALPDPVDIPVEPAASE